MPQLSLKSGQMPASPIRRLVPYAEKAKSENKQVLHLNIGQPDIPSPKPVIDALHQFPFSVLTYTASQGELTYRQQLVNYFQSKGIELKPDNFIVTQGGSEALDFILGIVANPGDEVICPEPFYANYNGFACKNDAIIIPVPPVAPYQYQLPDISVLEDKITDKTKAILICNPNNPTGYVYTDEELESLGQLAIKHDIFLIVDEVYAEYIYTEKKFRSILTFPEFEQNVIVVDSESKRFSMCGARIGAVVSRNAEILDAALRFSQARLSTVFTSQYIAIKAHENVGDYFEKSLAEYTKRKEILVEGLNKIPGVICPDPKGAFYCFVTLPIEDAEEFCIWLLKEFSYNGKTLMMAPGNGFYSDPSNGKNEVRIAYVLNQDDLQDAISILDEALKVYPGVISATKNIENV